MLSDVMDKRIDELSVTAEELIRILQKQGWTDYSYRLLSKLQKLAIILEDEDETKDVNLDDLLAGFHSDDEEEGGGNGKNTRLPFGLCIKEGIKIDPSWSPKDAWEALKKKGYSVSEAYKRLKETGDAGSIEPEGENSRGHRFSEAVVRALRPKKNEAIFFSGCAQRDENGNTLKNSVSVATEYAKNNKGTTMGMLLEAGSADIPEWDFDDAESIHSWEDASRVYAEQASGDVRVIAKPPLRKGNIFENVELPALKENPNVTSVTMINPETNEKTVIFRR